MVSVCQFFHPLPLPNNEEEIILRLKKLYVKAGDGPPADQLSTTSAEAGSVASEVEEEDAATVKERELKSRVCGTVLTSYDMSLRDTMQLASSKLSLARELIGQLGGEINREKPQQP